MLKTDLQDIQPAQVVIVVTEEVSILANVVVLTSTSPSGESSVVTALLCITIQHGEHVQLKYFDQAPKHLAFGDGTKEDIEEVHPNGNFGCMAYDGRRFTPCDKPMYSERSLVVNQSRLHVQ